MFKKPPCYKEGKKCDKRVPGCHSKCDEYKDWRQERESKIAEIRKVRYEQRQLDDALFDRHRNKNKIRRGGR